MDPGLKTLQQEIAAAMEGMSPEQMGWQSAGKWSAGEIFEHLYLTYTGTMKGFERVLALGQPKVSPVTLKQRVGRLLVLGFSYLPSGREAPAMARPKGLPCEKVLAEVVGKIAEMDAMIARCEELLGPGELLDHVILGPLTGAEWRKFHVVHGRHHLKQVWKLQESCRASLERTGEGARPHTGT
ncbi:MAG TPA: DUF1569 domain-containing protein [Candidatus Solibacter sp.]|nr:DUF1569 domain-containing protein [Candidatus Solibacter sp.]